MTLKDLLNENDMFAKSSGIRLVEVREGYARAQMTVEKRHLNMGGVCQGGAIFTLADFAFAAVCNCHGKLTVGLENTVSFLHSAQLGDVLTAEAVETLNHHKVPFCEMKVRNQNGELICSMTGLSYRKNQDLTFEGLE